jgi:GAF domain-containing protein
MSFSRPQSGTGHPGGISHVPASSAEPTLSAEELASLSLAERAAHALARERGPREIPIDRAFLEASLDLGRAIRTMVAAFIPRFADWCFVDLVDGDGVPHRVEVAPADPGKLPLAAEMLSLGFGPGWATPSAQAIRDRAPRLYREVSPELLAWATHDERHHAVFSAMDPRSLVAVPLVARGQCIGAITLFRSTMVPPLDETGMVIAEQIAAPAALAIDNARRFEGVLRGLAPSGASPSGEPSLDEEPIKRRRRVPAKGKGPRKKPRKAARAPTRAKRGKAPAKKRGARR